MNRQNEHRWVLLLETSYSWASIFVGIFMMGIFLSCDRFFFFLISVLGCVYFEDFKRAETHVRRSEAEKHGAALPLRVPVVELVPRHARSTCQANKIKRNKFQLAQLQQCPYLARSPQSLPPWVWVLRMERRNLKHDF